MRHLATGFCLCHISQNLGCLHSGFFDKDRGSPDKIKKQCSLFETFVSSTIALSVTNWLVRVEIILGRISLRCLLAGRGPQVYSFLGTFGGWRRILISGGEGQTIELVAHLT